MTIYGLNEKDLTLLKRVASYFKHFPVDLVPYRGRGHGGGSSGFPIPVKCTAEDARDTTTPAPTTTSGTTAAPTTTPGGTTPAPTTTIGWAEGYHTFKECDWQGNILTGDDERVFKNCILAGDFLREWDISIASGSESFGLLWNLKGQNVVVLLPYPGNAYYYE